MTDTTTAAANAAQAIVLTAVVVGDGAQRAAQPAATTPAAVSLCVGVAPLLPTSEPGQPAQWAVAVWAIGGNVPDATIRLQASPVSAGTPLFSFGCAGGNGTSVCDLGAVDAGSTQRQLQVQLAVPATVAVTSVSLTATGSATGLLTSPAATAVVSIVAAASPTPSLPTGSLPGSTTASPGGSAGELFPTVAPSSGSGVGGTSQVANTSTFSPGDHLTVQVAGLAALFAAFVLAVTRVSIRRPGAAPPGGAGASPSAEADEETQELGGTGEADRRSRGAESAKRMRTLSGRRAQTRPGSRHKRR